MLFTLGLLLTTAASAATDLSNADLSQKIDHYAQAHLRAERALKDYDRELNEALAAGNPGLLRRSSAYRQLQALRELKHSDVDAIGEHLENLEATNPTAAKAAENSIRVKLSTLTNEDRSAAAALFADIAGHHEEISGMIASNFTPLLQPRLEVAFAESRPAMNLQLRPGLLDLEMAEITSDLDFSPAEPPSDRIEVSASDSRAAKIRPGTGPEGNITGRNFPLNTWALTFDDGPHPKFTKMALDALKQHRKKATFFWLAQNVVSKGNQEAISLARAAGMSLNDHSFSHADLNRVSADKLEREIHDSADIEARIYGKRPEFFRLPYGSGVRNMNVRQLIADGNMIHVFWNVDSLDWQDKNPASILARVKKSMQLEKRGIILFHDIHPQSVEAAKQLLDYSDTLDNTRQQIRWVTLPEIRDELNR